MENNNLWSVDNCGTVHSFDIKTKQWFQLDYQRLEFKRLSSSPQSLWAIGGDHQIYIFVPSSDIPIRVCALTYENQRWNPLSQFSSRLLPTDRPLFSCADGTLPLPKDGFKLPSKHWQWEREWFIDDNIEGEPLGPEGWTYAIDFPMTFSSERRWNSLVRRRRWLRYRRYVCVNEWALLEDSIHADFVKEPFIDIATGGYDISGGNKDCLAVWAVTVIGRVMFRTGVERLCPEGISWVNIEVPTGWEVNQISCGPTGLVWAVAWDGSALIRSGVNRDNIRGNTWIRVEPPNDSKLMQISVGVDAIWALTRDSKVWFRKGVRGLNSGHNDMSASGSGWIEMVQEMGLLSVTPNDQIWALSVDKKCIYFRTGITYGELTGKSWKLVSRQPINVSNNKNSKNIEQQLDSISISSQDSCFSSNLFDTQTMAWIWISASNCSINADSYLNSCSSSSYGSLPSLNQSFGNGSNDRKTSAEEPEWRSNILKQLNTRYEKEMKDFMSTYKRVVESGTWVKTGTCFVAKLDRTTIHWCPGLLELERQGAETNTESGTLIISYSKSSHSPSKLSKNVLNLAEIRCCFIDSTESGLYPTYNCLVIIANSDFKIKFRSEEEMEDWLTTINLNCGDLHGFNGRTVTSSPVLYCLTKKGDLYVGNQLSGDNIFYYLLCGGHFQSLTVAANICWALSYDNVLWIHNSGTGGGIYKGITGVNSYCNPMSDSMTFYCYENQRWNPLTGFASKGLPTDRYMWSDDTGKHELIKELIKVPSKQWQWVSDWAVDYLNSNEVDSEGWQYSIDFPFDYHSKRLFTDYVRRRRWYRRCKLTTTGPWTDLSSISIISASIHCSNYDKDIEDDVILNVWAVSSEGEALCRLGVSRLCPRGLSWEYVPCDQPLLNISVGGDQHYTHVWAIARDGSAFLRHGITRTSPSGTVWFHTECPRPQCPLKQISVGKSNVWAIDAKNRLWFREEIVETFPEGTHWRKVCDESVQQISANNCDNLWAIIKVKEYETFIDRIAKRIGINENHKMGTDWDFVTKEWNSLKFICAVDRSDDQN